MEGLVDNVERLMGIYCANNCGKHATAMVQAMERSVGLVEEGRREEDSKEGEGPRRVNTDSLVMSLLDCEARLAELQGIEAVNEGKREHTRKQHAESLSVLKAEYEAQASERKRILEQRVQHAVVTQDEDVHREIRALTTNK